MSRFSSSLRKKKIEKLTNRNQNLIRGRGKSYRNVSAIIRKNRRKKVEILSSEEKKLTSKWNWEKMKKQSRTSQHILTCQLKSKIKLTD